LSDTNPPENPSGALPEGTEPTAPLPTEPTEPTAALPADAIVPPPAAPAPAAGKRSRRTAIVALVAVVVVAVLGGGAFAAWKVFFAGGPQPAEALPASTIAILTIDLNPSAGQKIEAIKTIRKFPALKKSVGLDTQDDLRRFIFDKATEAAGCKGFDFDEDMKPWIGKRAAVAAVDLGDDTPAPAIVLQITDSKMAKAGFSKLAHCGDFGTDFGFAVGDDYLIASDSAAHAQAIIDQGEKKSLADDAAYQKWTDEVGDQGVVNFYIAKKAAKYLVDGLEELASSFGAGFEDSASSSGGGSDDGSDQELGGGFSAPLAADCSGDPFDAAKEQLDKFEGLAGTIRFADGGMELSMATSGVEQLASTATVGKQVSKLPADTAIVAGLGIPDGYAKQLFDSIKCGAGSEADDFIKQAEEETGLSLPDDLETLLGSALTISVGGDAPANLEEIDDPSDLPVGLLINGDADAIKDLISQVEDRLGFQLSDIPIGIKSTDSRLAASPSEDYADDLLKDGSLGSSSTFKEAVPNADRAAGIFYIDFNSDWRETLIKLAKESGAVDDEVSVFEDNSKPLKSFGVSSWTKDGTSHLLLKLATD
jgi:hypothetical protein